MKFYQNHLLSTLFSANYRKQAQLEKGMAISQKTSVILKAAHVEQTGSNYVL